jgi:hypothetical protein
MLALAAAAAVAAATPAPPRAPAQPVLLPDAAVTVVVSYPACGVRREGRGPVPPGLAGLTEREAARALAPDRVAAFSPRGLVLERTLPGCPGDAVTLAVRGGEVVVRAGPPGDLGPVVDRTGIPARALGPDERARLENGWSVPAGDLPAVLSALRDQSGAPAARPGG